MQSFFNQHGKFSHNPSSYKSNPMQTLNSHSVHNLRHWWQLYSFWNTKMINIDKFVLKDEVQNNPLVKIHLKAMKWFGYMIFEHQNVKRLQCFRGVVFTVSFILFNISQVNLWDMRNLCEWNGWKIFSFLWAALELLIVLSFREFSNQGLDT